MAYRIANSSIGKFKGAHSPLVSLAIVMSSSYELDGDNWTQ
jgi:hypothetical protein